MLLARCRQRDDHPSSQTGQSSDGAKDSGDRENWHVYRTEIAILTLVVLGKRDNAAVCLRIRESRAGPTVHKGTRLTL